NAHGPTFRADTVRRRVTGGESCRAPRSRWDLTDTLRLSNDVELSALLLADLHNRFPVARHPVDGGGVLHDVKRTSPGVSSSFACHPVVGTSRKGDGVEIGTISAIGSTIAKVTGLKIEGGCWKRIRFDFQPEPCRQSSRPCRMSLILQFR